MDTVKTFLIFIIITAFFASTPAKSYAARPKITRVSFEGNEVYSDRALRRMIVTRKSSLFKTRRLFREVLKEDIRKILTFYQNNGYLASEVREETSIEPEKNEANVTIKINEGERFTVSTVMTLGNEFYSDSKLFEKAGINPGDYFTKSKLDAATSRILSTYSDNGFSDVELNTDLNVNHLHNTVSVDFFIIERDRYRISDVLIRGNIKTRPSVLKRELTFRKGEYVNFSRIFRSRQNLLRTGLFRSVFINHIPAISEHESPKKDIVVQVEERDSIELAASAGYDTREHFWQQAEITNRNLYGTARRGGIVLRRSSIEKKAEASLSSPWTFGMPLLLDLNLFYGYTKEPGFEVVEAGGGAALSRAFMETVRVMLSYDHKVSEFRRIERDAFTKKRVSKNIITLQGTHDTRDSLFYPGKGTYARLKNELMFGEISFLRTSADARIFHPVTPSIVGGSALRYSVIFSNLESREIPPDERLYTGGPYSVRGFKYHSLGPLDYRSKPVGGKASLVWNIAEARMNLYKSLGLTAFADAGNVWQTIEETDLTDLRTSAGGGLLLTLPFGVFRLEYSLNLDRKKGETPGILFFGSGMVF